MLKKIKDKVLNSKVVKGKLTGGALGVAGIILVGKWFDVEIAEADAALIVQAIALGIAYVGKARAEHQATQVPTQEN